MGLWLVVACTDSEGAAGDSAPAPEVVVPAIVINEFVTANRTTVADAAGEFDDWLELYNGGDVDVALGGFYLNDYPQSIELLGALPDRTLAPGGFLLVWCDGDPGSDDEVHVPFQLGSGSQEALSLVWSPEVGQAPVIVDTFMYAGQDGDAALGRVPDGDPTWAPTLPTPGAANQSAR